MKRTYEEVAERRAIAFVLREQGYTLQYIAAQIGYSDHAGIRRLLESHEYEFKHSKLYQKILVQTRYKLGTNSVQTS